MNTGKYLYSLRGLMQLKRYQNKKKLLRRTTIDHIWATTKISQMLAYWHEEATGEVVNMEELLQGALLNGTIKLFTGEIQGNTKSATKEIEEAIREVEEIIYDEKYVQLAPEELKGDKLKKYVLYAKDNTIEGKILKTAGLIDTCLECVEEISLSNTQFYEQILEDAMQQVDEIGLVVGKWFLESLVFKFIERYKEGPKSVEQTNNNIKQEFLDTFPKYVVNIRNLMETERYQNVFRNKVRSVAHHEWSVAMIALCIAKEEQAAGGNVNIGELLQVALCHDDIEMISGDILSKTKRVTSTLGKEIEKVEAMFFEEHFSKMLPRKQKKIIRERVLNPKSNTVEGKIIRIADVVDTLFEAVEEINLSNTLEFTVVYESAIEKLQHMKGSITCFEEFCDKVVPEKERLSW